jgi:hypothetical protein
MPAGTKVPLEGFWGARENFRIFQKGVPNIELSNCSIIRHIIAIPPLELLGTVVAKTQS